MSAQNDVSDGDISQKYKDAFRNLSMELKKRIKDVKKVVHEEPSIGANNTSGVTEDYMSNKYLLPSNRPAAEKPNG